MPAGVSVGNVVLNVSESVCVRTSLRELRVIGGDDYAVWSGSHTVLVSNRGREGSSLQGPEIALSDLVHTLNCFCNPGALRVSLHAPKIDLSGLIYSTGFKSRGHKGQCLLGQTIDLSGLVHKLYWFLIKVP